MARILEDIFPDGIRLDDLKEYRPPPLAPDQQLRVAMAESGIQAPDDLVFDGRFHRFSTTAKRSQKSGWYIAFDSGNIPAGAFGDWRQGIESTWRADIGRELSAIEQMQHASRMRSLREMREKEIAAAREDAAERAAQMWESAPLASDDHPYLQRKGITNPGLRVAPDGRLLAPMYIDDELVSLQQIDGAGQKMFLKGGKSGGAWWHIGAPISKDSPTVYIAEGVGTASSIFEATGQAVAVAYSANNLTATAKAVRERVGIGCDVVVVADHDTSGVGQAEAQKAAEAIQARVIIPPDVGDANDYAQAGGDLATLLLPPKVTDGYLEDADTFSQPRAPIQWLIKHWIPRNGLVMIHGPSGGGKTFALLDMLCRIAAGMPSWGDGRIVKPSPVVYLAGEGHHGLRGRLAGWKMANLVNSFGGRMHISRSGTDLNTADGYRMVRESILALPDKPGVIAIDTLHRFLAGDENSAQDAKTMIDACAGLMREFGCAVVLVHHTGVSEDAQHRARGSSAWRGALDIEISVLPGKELGDPLVLSQKKNKDADMAPNISMILRTQPLGWVDEDGEEVATAVAEYVGGADAMPESRALKAKREAFEQACRHLGSFTSNDQAAGRIYITAQSLIDHWATLQFESESTRRSNLSKVKRELMDAGYIRELDGRYVLIKEETMPMLRMEMHQPTGA